MENRREPLRVDDWDSAWVRPARGTSLRYRSVMWHPHEGATLHVRIAVYWVACLPVAAHACAVTIPEFL